MSSLHRSTLWWMCLRGEQDYFNTSILVSLVYRGAVVNYRDSEPKMKTAFIHSCHCKHIDFLLWSTKAKTFVVCPSCSFPCHYTENTSCQPPTMYIQSVYMTCALYYDSFKRHMTVFCIKQAEIWVTIHIQYVYFHKAPFPSSRSYGFSTHLI